MTGKLNRNRARYGRWCTTRRTTWKGGGGTPPIKGGAYHVPRTPLGDARKSGTLAYHVPRR